MITEMQKYEIIKLKLNGWSTCRISKEFNVSRNTIKKYWDAYLEKRNALLTKDGDTSNGREVIESIIEKPHYDTSNRKPLKYSKEIDIALRKILDDEINKTKILGKNHKQGLTKVQIHKLLIKQGFDIGLSTINNKINEIRNESKEVYICQQYDYGERFEYDFGEVKLYIDGKLTIGYLAVMVLPASNFRWAYLYHNSKFNVFIDSQVRFFELINGVPKEGVYDNMKNVVSKFIGKHQKDLNIELIKFATYYGFNINVTNCYSGNEKGTVEGAVKFIRNKVFGLEYSFKSFQEAEEYLQKELVNINKESRINEEKQHLQVKMPKYETCTYLKCNVDKYSFIRVDKNNYSVPEDINQKPVDVKLYPNEVIIYYKNKEIARHYRLIGKEKTCVDIRHYLHTFLRKPGALKNSLAIKADPRIKDIFDTYYKEKPKAFIEIIRENRNLNNDELVERLIPNSKTYTEKVFDNVVFNSVKQVLTISKLFH